MRPHPRLLQGSPRGFRRPRLSSASSCGDQGRLGRSHCPPFPSPSPNRPTQAPTPGPAAAPGATSAPPGARAPPQDALRAPRGGTRRKSPRTPLHCDPHALRGPGCGRYATETSPPSVTDALVRLPPRSRRERIHHSTDTPHTHPAPPRPHPPRCAARAAPPPRDATSGARPAPPPDKRRRAEPRALFRRAAQDGGHAGGAAPPRDGTGPGPGLHPAASGPPRGLRRRGLRSGLRRAGPFGGAAAEAAGGLRAGGRGAVPCPGVPGRAPGVSGEPCPGVGVPVRYRGGGLRPEPFVMPPSPPADRAGLPEAAHDLPEQEAGAAGRGRQGEAAPLLQEHRPRLQDSQGGKARPPRGAWAGRAASAPLLGSRPGQLRPESCGGPVPGLCVSAHGLGQLGILGTITKPPCCLDCLSKR